MQPEFEKLLWIDLEMTGLDPRDDAIIEVAAIVTSGTTFQQVDSYEAVIHYQPEHQKRMQEAVLQQWSENQPESTTTTLFDLHSDSGLIQRIKNEGISSNQAEEDLIELTKKHWPEQKAILGGNSIHQDRRFIRQQWPQFNELLHYRMLDVTSFKIIQQLSGLKEYQKTGTHRAKDDIEESIAELKHYLSETAA